MADNPERFHLLPTLDGVPAMHGWWDSEATARQQFVGWIGERGSMPGARITLVDTSDGRVIHRWPDET